MRHHIIYKNTNIIKITVYKCSFDKISLLIVGFKKTPNYPETEMKSTTSFSSIQNLRTKTKKALEQKQTDYFCIVLNSAVSVKIEQTLIMRFKLGDNKKVEEFVYYNGDLLNTSIVKRLQT